MGTASFDYFMEADFQKFKGEWVAIMDDEIIAHAPSESSLLERLSEQQRREVLVTKIPDENQIMIL